MAFESPAIRIRATTGGDDDAFAPSESTAQRGSAGHTMPGESGGRWVICGKQTIRVGGAALLLLSLGATADRAHAQDQAADPAQAAAPAPVEPRDDASLDLSLTHI